jgi:hypothetical protein
MKPRLERKRGTSRTTRSTIKAKGHCRPCLDDVLNRLYRDEINVQIATDWDAGFRVELGGPMAVGNSVIAEFETRDLRKAIEWLVAEVPKHWPDSKFSSWAKRQRHDAEG